MSPASFLVKKLVIFPPPSGPPPAPCIAACSSTQHQQCCRSCAGIARQPPAQKRLRRQHFFPQYGHYFVGALLARATVNCTIQSASRMVPRRTFQMW